MVLANRKGRLLAMPGTTKGQSGWYQSNNQVHQFQVTDGKWMRIAESTMDVKQWQRKQAKRRARRWKWMKTAQKVINANRGMYHVPYRPVFIHILCAVGVKHWSTEAVRKELSFKRQAEADKKVQVEGTEANVVSLF